MRFGTHGADLVRGIESIVDGGEGVHTRLEECQFEGDVLLRSSLGDLIRHQEGRLKLLGTLLQDCVDGGPEQLRATEGEDQGGDLIVESLDFAEISRCDGLHVGLDLLEERMILEFRRSGVQFVEDLLGLALGDVEDVLHGADDRGEVCVQLRC